MRYKIRIRIVKVKNNEIRFVARIHNNTKTERRRKYTCSCITLLLVKYLLFLFSVCKWLYAVNWSILIFAFQLILPIFGITYNFSFHLTLKVHKRSSLLSSLVNKRVDKCTRVYFIHACYHQHFCKLRLNLLELPLGQNHLYLSLFMFSTGARFFFFYLFGFRIDLQYIIDSFPYC